MKTYIHKQSESVFSRIVKLYLRFTGFKHILGKDLDSGKNRDFVAKIPSKISSKYEVLEKRIGRRIWTINSLQKKTNKTIVYFHGGAYFYNVLSLHWDFIAKLISKTNATIVVPEYPLVPHATHKEVYEFLHKVYDDILESSNGNEIIFMGDSAGGGLALGFAQYLVKKQLKIPTQLILLAPWLDLSMENPDMKEVEKHDVALSKEALALVGKKYAGNQDISNPELSPINGDFDGFKNISLFIGSYDLFIADARKLKNMLEKSKIRFSYFEYPKMIHVWMFVPFLKEGKSAINQIVSLIKNH